MRTLELSSNKTSTYYLTAITEEQKEILFKIKKEHTKKIEQDELLNDLSYKWGIDCGGILKIGETALVKTSALSSYVGQFAGKDTEGKGTVGWNREVHFRNYGKTLEQQMETSWLVNQCSERSSSVRTALKLMDEKWCILWEIGSGTPFKKEMDELLKDKVCINETY